MCCTQYCFAVSSWPEVRCKMVEPINQHQHQKQQDSGAMFLRCLATTAFFLWHGLLRCLRWWRYKTENCWRHNCRWTPNISLQFRRMRKWTAPILHKLISTWYRFYGPGDLQYAPGCSLISFLMTTTSVEQVKSLLAWNNSIAARDGYLRKRKYPSSYSFHRLFAVRKIVFFVEKTKLFGLLDDITIKIDDNRVRLVIKLSAPQQHAKRIRIGAKVDIKNSLCMLLIAIS